MRDFIREALGTKDGKPLEADIVLMYDENTRLLGDFLHSKVKQYPRFLIVAEDADNRKIKVFKPERISCEDAIVMCVMGSVEVCNGM